MGKSALGPWRAETMVEMGVRKADWEHPGWECGPQEGAEVESELGCFAMKSSADPTGHFGGEISLVKRPDLYLILAPKCGVTLFGGQVLERDS